MSLGTKTGLFNQMMSTRDELTPEFVEEASKEIQKKVLSLEEFRTSLRVGLYSCYKNEIRTETLLSKVIRIVRKCITPRWIVRAVVLHISG